MDNGQRNALARLLRAQLAAYDESEGGKCREEDEEEVLGFGPEDLECLALLLPFLEEAQR